MKTNQRMLRWIVCALGGPCFAVETTAPRPNIRFIASDDHSCQSIGASRTWLSGFIREQKITPDIDRLADQPALIVNPPPGREAGYVPIVTRQAATE
jgi:hypothetical protein